MRHTDVQTRMEYARTFKRQFCGLATWQALYCTTVHFHPNNAQSCVSSIEQTGYTRDCFRLHSHIKLGWCCVIDFFHICMRITQIDFKLNETILKIDCSFAYRTVCLQWKHESIFGMDTWFIAIISQLSENVPFSSNFVCCMVECSTFLLKKNFFFMNHSYVKKTASYTNHSIQRIIHPFQTQITFWFSLFFPEK